VPKHQKPADNRTPSRDKKINAYDHVKKSALTDHPRIGRQWRTTMPHATCPMPQSPYREMEASLKQSAEERRRQINGIGLGSSLYTFIYIHVYIAFGLEERFAASG